MTLDLDVAHMGGATGGDYSGVPASVTFASGETRRTFRFTAVQDTEDDDGESVAVTFASALPDRVSAGAGTTLAIQDDDDPAPVEPGPTPTREPPPPPPPEAAFAVDVDCPEDPCRVRADHEVTFTDTSSGTVTRRLWEFGDGRTSRGRAPTRVWSEPGFYAVTLVVSDGEVESTASRTFLVEAAAPAGACAADDRTRCLQDSRFAVAVDWRTADGAEGGGDVVHAGSNDSALFSFFGGGNWEVLIKVLDGCSVNGHVWVYGASTTDLGYAIRLTDTVTGETKEYRNEPAAPARAITDVTAFPGACRDD